MIRCSGLCQIAIYFALILLIAKPLGLFMARVFEGRARSCIRCCAGWKCSPTERPASVKTWSSAGRNTRAAAQLQHLRLPAHLPAAARAGLPAVEPAAFRRRRNVPPDLAFNTAVSFMTNTNWQAYGGETTLSYFVQMAALTVQNFASAAAGIAIAIALIRGFARQEKKTIGNFWVDVTRATVYVLLPLSDRRRRCSSSRRAWFRTLSLHRRDHRRRRQADDRAGPGGVAGSHQAARARTAAASSTRTPRIRSRTRRR